MRNAISAAIAAVLVAAATVPAISQVATLPPCLPDCAGADLQGADLRWADLSGADLSGANLSYADLSWADLSEADMSGATVFRADISGANLSGTDLTDVRGCDLGRLVTDECPYDDEIRDAISQFMRTFRYGARDDLANHIQFPLRREYPIPPIERDEFLTRYEEVFDQEITTFISDSSPRDWRLDAYNILLWDEERRIGVSLSPYAIPAAHVRWIASSERERGERERLLQLRNTLRVRERSQLHGSLHEYESPVLEWGTAAYRVRVDRLDNGEYRYAAWPSDGSHSEEPDLVIGGGRHYMAASTCGTETTRLHGFAGGEVFGFANGEYLYEVDAFDCWCQGPEDNPDGPAGNHECDYNLRVWHSPGRPAVVPEFVREWEDLKDGYELIVHEPFNETPSLIDAALHADYRRAAEREPVAPAADRARERT